MGEEISDFSVRSVVVEQQEIDDPFEVTVTVQNTGNTELASIEGGIDVYKKDDTEKLKALSFIQPKTPLAFNETRELKMVYTDFKPEPGSYWVDVEATKDGETVYENRLFKQVKEEEIPVIMPEDAMVQPAIMNEKGSMMVEDQLLAPAAPPESSSERNQIYIYLFIALATFVIGVVAYVQLR